LINSEVTEVTDVTEVRLRLRFLLVPLLIACSAPGVLAQSGDVPRPDTLGANFDITTPGTGGPDLFDYLVGEWTFRFQTRREDGTYNPPRSGHWKTWKSHDGRMVEDEWSIDQPADGPRRMTITYRAWNPERRLWEIVGVVPGVGSFDPGIAWGSGSERLLVQHYGDFITRIKYYDITPNHFLWRADGSGDGGRTWTRDLWRMEATRIR
jgi:hypothetical protein